MFPFAFRSIVVGFVFLSVGFITGDASDSDADCVNDCNDLLVVATGVEDAGDLVGTGVVENLEEVELVVEDLDLSEDSSIET